MPAPRLTKRRVCVLPGCDRPHHARGLCNACYLRAYRKMRADKRAKARAALRRKG